ncbi:MAG: alpha/beta hydrolase [Pyrinomonadaceae bacterium]|nr:alpha/beta hydrolase [Pyrinomonadaceae bacterium]
MNWREFQAKQKAIEIGDRFVSYVDEGAGEPIILIHGIPTWGYLWHKLIPVLSKQNRVLAPDLAGFGYSDKRDNFDRAIDKQAELIDAWMNETGVEAAHIVAHDIGGGVALRLATLFPNRVKKLCVMNGVSYDSWAIEAMIQLGHPSAYKIASASTSVHTLRQMLKQGFAETPEDEILDGIFAPYTTEVGKLSLIRNATALNTNLTTGITHLLPQIEAETLILWGVDDKFQLLKYGERLADDIPNARLVKIENARHFVMIDQPEIVAEYVSNFLK